VALTEEVIEAFPFSLDLGGRGLASCPEGGTLHYVSDEAILSVNAGFLKDGPKDAACGANEGNALL
jgi:hypothetical protein